MNDNYFSNLFPFLKASSSLYFYPKNKSSKGNKNVRALSCYIQHKQIIALNQ